MIVIVYDVSLICLLLKSTASAMLISCDCDINNFNSTKEQVYLVFYNLDYGNIGC